MKNNYGFVRGKRIDLFFPFDWSINAKIKSIPGYRFHGDRKPKHWSIPLDQAHLALERLTMFEFPDEVFQVADKSNERQKILKHLATLSNATDAELEIPGLPFPLLPYQRAGVLFADLAERSGNFDEMGLGKTVEALALLQYRPELRPAVVVSPSSVKYNWSVEARKWVMANSEVQIINGLRTQNKTRQKDGQKYKVEIIQQLEDLADIYLINYDILYDWVDALAEIAPKITIFDEAHYIKDSSTRQAKASYQLIEASKKVLLMTGTPILNRPIELFPLLQIIDPTKWNNKVEYGKRFCNAKLKTFRVKGGKERQAWDFTGASNLDQLAKEIRPYAIRRLKVDVQHDLPAKSRFPLYFEMEPRFIREYQSSVQEAKEAIQLARIKNEPIGAIHLTMINKCRQIATKGKLKGCIAWINDVIQDQKLVVFAKHLFVIDALMEEFDGKALKIDGSVPTKHRQEIVETFQTSDNWPLFVGQLRAAREGITLTKAHTGLMTESEWAPGYMTQAEDRLHRITQKHHVNWYYAICDVRVDRMLVELLHAKQQISDTVLDQGRQPAGSFKIINDKEPDSFLNEYIQEVFLD